ncbi:uncharacterized protein HRG_02103 [Hirsutella rhossiliensis]|uniref:Uncharacterized protein n=1 Tax=Hirsutella rhossiliensis TaxID=111463 RepID=A0A9P8SLW0_9HYPO|nr:uncharacterized protein HRG_02103 [Hirsutella rhossiliensis]KAH0966694.1 hypothetical protein HRG_02103 [Hirsutella rhossiliensis]
MNVPPRTIPVLRAGTAQRTLTRAGQSLLGLLLPEQHNSYVLAVVVRLLLPLQDQLRFGPEERKLMALETIAEAARLWILNKPEDEDEENV